MQQLACDFWLAFATGCCIRCCCCCIQSACNSGKGANLSVWNECLCVCLCVVVVVWANGHRHTNFDQGQQNGHLQLKPTGEVWPISARQSNFYVMFFRSCCWDLCGKGNNLQQTTHTQLVCSIWSTSFPIGIGKKGDCNAKNSARHVETQCELCLEVSSKKIQIC